MAAAGVVATLLPATAFSLKEPYADGRSMIDSNCAVALATDFNPGSCFTESIPLIFALATLYMDITTEEAVTAVTINAAAAIDRARGLGWDPEGALEESPGHSDWYVERFRSLAAQGADLHGEARLVDAMLERGARVLDAGCGPGRVGGRLAELGHEVVGVDLDRVLIAAAEQAGIRLENALVDFAHAAFLLRADPVTHGATVQFFRDATLHQKDKARLARKAAETHRQAWR